MNIVYVVNNRFYQFAEKHESVLTVAAFVDLIAKKAFTDRLNVILGQGVDADEMKALVERYAETPAMIELSINFSS